jgi:hypothetical protein
VDPIPPAAPVKSIFILKTHLNYHYFLDILIASHEGYGLLFAKSLITTLLQ